jgi:pyrimidine deaminase RibD-like protein
VSSNNVTPANPTPATVVTTGSDTADVSRDDHRQDRHGKYHAEGKARAEAESLASGVLVDI